MMARRSITLSERGRRHLAAAHASRWVLEETRIVKLWMLGSGSRGNAILVECDGSRILIDCGYGTRTLAGRLKTIGVTPDSIDGLSRDARARGPRARREVGDEALGVGAVRDAGDGARREARRSAREPVRRRHDDPLSHA